MEMTMKEMSELRVQHAKNTKSDGFARFAINNGGVKAISKIVPDNLSKADRAKINDAKDKLTYKEDEGDLW